MNMRPLLPTLSLIFILFTSFCRPAPNFVPRSLPLPQVPDSLTAPQDRAVYVSTHFWDNMDFADDAMALDSGLMEQSMVDFFSILNVAADPAVSNEAISALVKKAEVNRGGYELMADIAEKYLYETESPLLNEDMYQMFINAMMLTPWIDQASKMRLDFKSHQISRNRPGSSAVDIEVVDRNGDTLSLTACIDGRPAIVLFFDHDCESCIETIGEMTADKRLTDKLAESKLKVVAVDLAEDGDIRGDNIDNWVWTKARIDDVDEAYAMRSTPSLYLFGPDGCILLKDVSYSYLSQAIFHD